MTNNEMKNKKDRTAEKKIVNKTIKEDNQAKVFLKSICSLIPSFFAEYFPIIFKIYKRRIFCCC